MVRFRELASSWIARPEFDEEYEILVRLFADELAGLFVVHHCVVRQMPVGFPDLIPLFEVFAVEERDPAGFLA